MKHANHPEHADAVDPDVKDANLKRLRRIEGQIRGIHKMWKRTATAPTSSRRSPRRKSAARRRPIVAAQSPEACATSAIKKGPKEADATYDELLELVTGTCGETRTAICLSGFASPPLRTDSAVRTMPGRPPPRERAAG